MTAILEREGQQWAWGVVRDMVESSVVSSSDELIGILERGTVNKPAVYAEGVGKVIGLIRLEVNKRNTRGKQP